MTQKSIDYNLGLIEGWVISQTNPPVLILTAIEKLHRAFEELPAPEAEPPAEPESECESCGAPAVYDVEDHGLRCDECYRDMNEEDDHDPLADRLEEADAAGELEEEAEDPVIAKAEEVKSQQRRMRKWTPEEDALIIQLIKNKQKPDFITSEVNRLSPENPRTRGAVEQRMFKLKAAM